MFERFRRSSAAAQGRISCYGKLPLDREFLRYHLDSDEGRWIVSWVDGAHQVIVENDAAVAKDSPLELRVILARGGGRSAVAALIRPSLDGGNRSYPVCVFSILDGRRLRDQWHLMPLAVAPIWETLEREVLDSSIPNRSAFATILDRVTCAPQSPEAAEARFQEATRASVESPWGALTGASGEPARQAALTLVHVAAAQAGTRGANDGVALRIPLGIGEGVVSDTAVQAGAWMRLFTAVSGSTDPSPAVVEIRDRNTGRSLSGCIFGREPSPEDLAHLLAGVGDPAIDDLNQTWDTEPPSECARGALAGLLDQKSRCLADLWENI